VDKREREISLSLEWWDSDKTAPRDRGVTL
jgi:hypothetical protein